MWFRDRGGVGRARKTKSGPSPFAVPRRVCGAPRVFFLFSRNGRFHIARTATSVCSRTSIRKQRWPWILLPRLEKQRLQIAESKVLIACVFTEAFRVRGVRIAVPALAAQLDRAGRGHLPDNGLAGSVGHVARWKNLIAPGRHVVLVVRVEGTVPHDHQSLWHMRHINMGDYGQASQRGR